MVSGLTPGGSSGGESSLIAVHGSPMGIGTDIGGSIVSDLSTLQTSLREIQMLHSVYPQLTWVSTV